VGIAAGAGKARLKLLIIDSAQPPTPN
jgi:hypothetical protein